MGEVAAPSWVEKSVNVGEGLSVVLHVGGLALGCQTLGSTEVAGARDVWA